MSRAVRMARWVFGVAGIYGLIVLLPLFFAEPMFARYAPPPLTHPEYFYGFLGAVVCWQLVYLSIARDPVRFHPLMPIAAVAKLNFVAIVGILFAQGRLSFDLLTLPVIDLLLGIAFAYVWLRMKREPDGPAAERG